MVHDLQRNHPTAAHDVKRTTRVRSKVERSRACAPLTKTQDSGVFRACAFRAKNPECYGFFWQCKRYNKNPGFLDFGFCQCKWAYCQTCKTNYVPLCFPKFLLLLWSSLRELLTYTDINALYSSNGNISPILVIHQQIAKKRKSY